MESRSKTAPSEIQPILLSPDDVIDRLGDLLILDVQNPKYATTVLPKAKRLGVDTSLKSLPKTQPILLTCLAGQRSFQAAQQLIQKGFISVYVLKGGVIAWQRAGHRTYLMKAPA